MESERTRRCLEDLDLYKEVQVEGWDGYGAKAVSPKTLAVAAQLVEATLDEPEISATPDGDIIMEWAIPGGSLTILVDPAGEITAQVRRLDNGASTPAQQSSRHQPSLSDPKGSQSEADHRGYPKHQT